jgi:hypothetical protein
MLCSFCPEIKMDLKRKTIARIWLSLTWLYAVIPAHATECPASDGPVVSYGSTTDISVLFRFDKSVLDSTFMDNAKSLAHLRSILSDYAKVSQIDSIIIVGASSPDGSPKRNNSLAGRRAIAIYSYITTNFPTFDEKRMRLAIVDGYWDGLILAVEADEKVPKRDALLGVLRNPNIDDYTKNLQLNNMNGGRTFAYLRDRYLLRHLRRATTNIEIVMTPEPEPEPVVVESEPIVEPVVEEPEVVVEPELVVVVEPEPVVEPEREQDYLKFYPVALRTNLLLDLIGGPNIGVEVPIGEHISVVGDFAWAHTRIANRYALQTMQGTVEGRWWFEPKGNILTGWNVGLYGTYSSRFDIQWGRGYQGDGYWSAGVSGGYSWRLTDNLNLDVSAMLGVVWLPEVRYYDPPQDGHLMWTETRYHATRFLPTMLRANLVWLIGAKKKMTR